MAGRPSDYCEEIVEKIRDGLISGLSLVKICDPDDMPNRITVVRWMDKYPEFATMCARARTEQADLMDDRIMEVVNKVENGDIDPHAAKVAISGLQWRASKLAPKKYGDRQIVQGDNDADPVNIKSKTMTEEQLDAEILKLAGKAEVAALAARKTAQSGETED